ncbi:MAG: hypothetical protein BWK80_10735 [Desulfobacteraceae bacterium IS3]|nr:MAG: hypothetical protein BWK80_10735 [Desulfobacteraceae bacterium IS3]
MSDRPQCQQIEKFTEECKNCIFAFRNCCKNTIFALRNCTATQKYNFLHSGTERTAAQTLLIKIGNFCTPELLSNQSA